MSNFDYRCIEDGELCIVRTTRVHVGVYLEEIITIHESNILDRQYSYSVTTNSVCPWGVSGSNGGNLSDEEVADAVSRQLMRMVGMAVGIGPLGGVINIKLTVEVMNSMFNNSARTYEEANSK